jgi:hypothetical protein
MTIFVLVLVFCLSLQNVQSIPTSKATATRTPAVKGRPRKSPAEKTLPANLDLKTLQLEELVNLKPSQYDTLADRKLYRQYFASHPKVQGVNLYDTHHASVAAALIGLSEESKQDRPWKSKMAASIRNLLDDTQLHPTQRQGIQEALSGIRYQGYNVNRYQHQLRTKGYEGLKKYRKQSADTYKSKNGITYGLRKHMLRKQNSLIDRPLSDHIGHEATPLQAVESTKSLGEHYSSKHALTRKLQEYLRTKNVSNADYAVAMGLRSKMAQQIHRKKETINQMNATSIQRTNSQGSTSAQSQLLHGPSSSSHASPPHHSASSHDPKMSPLLEGSTSVNPNDPEDWKLLEEMLRN